MCQAIPINMTEQLVSGTIQLTHPEWLWLILVLFIATLLLRMFARHVPRAGAIADNSNQRNVFVHPLMALLPGIRAGDNHSKIYLLLYMLTFFCLIAAMAEPVRIGEKRPAPPPERDIVFIVDTSVSMSLRDYMFNGQRIDRMSMLKGVLDRFIQQLEGDRLSIIVFGDAAYTLVPLTRDQGLLRRMIARIQTTMAGRFNNAGEAISLAVKQTQYGIIPNKVKRHRVLVLLTDADGSTGSIKPEVAAELALQANTPLYSVAIGAISDAAEENRLTGLIYEPVDYSLLAAMSKKTGAKSYQAGNTQGLEQAINDINQHEINQREVAPRYYRQPLYILPLLCALGLLLVLSFLPLMKIYAKKLAEIFKSKKNIGESSL